HRIDHRVGCPARNQGDQKRLSRSHWLTPRTQFPQRNQDMNMDLAAAMRAATELTRAQKLMEATRLLQSALSGREVAPTEPPYAQAAKGQAIEGRVIDLTPNITARDITVPFQRKPDAPSEGSRPQPLTNAWSGRGVSRDTRP